MRSVEDKIEINHYHILLETCRQAVDDSRERKEKPYKFEKKVGCA